MKCVSVSLQHHQDQLEGCCQGILFLSPRQLIVQFPLVAVNVFKQSCPPGHLQNGVHDRYCLWHPLASIK